MAFLYGLAYFLTQFMDFPRCESALHIRPAGFGLPEKLCQFPWVHLDREITQSKWMPGLVSMDQTVGAFTPVRSILFSHHSVDSACQRIHSPIHPRRPMSRHGFQRHFAGLNQQVAKVYGKSWNGGTFVALIGNHLQMKVRNDNCKLLITKTNKRKIGSKLIYIPIILNILIAVLISSYRHLSIIN